MKVVTTLFGFLLSLTLHVYRRQPFVSTRFYRVYYVSIERNFETSEVESPNVYMYPLKVVTVFTLLWSLK